MFVVDLYLTFSYFVSFVRAYCSESLVRLMSMSRASCNSFNACRSLRDRLCVSFVICISASCDFLPLSSFCTRQGAEIRILNRHMKLN